MYGIPQNLDLSFLHGRDLLQICFGIESLILNFDEGVSVTIMSAINVISVNAKARFEEYAPAAPLVLPLLRQKISAVEGNRNGTLILGFDSGQTLEILDDSKQYESYTIRNGAKLIVV